MDELEKYRLKEAVFLNDEVLFNYYEANCAESEDVHHLMDFLEHLVKSRYNTRAGG